MSRSHNTCEMGGAPSLLPCFAFPSMSSVGGNVGRPAAHGCHRACLRFRISQSSALLHNTASRHERASGHGLRAWTRVQHPAALGFQCIHSVSAGRKEKPHFLCSWTQSTYGGSGRGGHRSEPLPSGLPWWKSFTNVKSAV